MYQRKRRQQTMNYAIDLEADRQDLKLILILLPELRQLAFHYLLSAVLALSGLAGAVFADFEASGTPVPLACNLSNNLITRSSVGSNFRASAKTNLASVPFPCSTSTRPR